MVSLIRRSCEFSFLRNALSLKSFDGKSVRVFRRFFNAEAGNTLVILGNSNIGARIAQEGVRRGHRVIVTSRTKHQRANKSNKIEFLHTPPQHLKDASYWSDLMFSQVPSSGRFLVVNTIGGSESTPQVSIEDLNVHIPLAAIEGITKAVKSKESQANYHVVHLSTAAAAGLQAPYGKTKRKVEECLMGLPLSHLTIFRMGYVAEPFIKHEVTQVFKKQHQLSSEELALLPLSFLIGDPIHYNRVMMPIVAIEDVVSATFNVCNLPPQKVIMDAVCQEVLTQEQFFSFFSHLLCKKKFRFIYMPIDAATKLVKHFDFGHFKSYAVEYCAQEKSVIPSHVDFAKLVGNPLKTLSEIFRLSAGQELVIPRPPLTQFAAHALTTLWNKPESRRDALDAIKIIARSLVSNGFPTPLPRPVSLVSYRWSTLSEKGFNKHAEENRLRKL